MSIALLIIFILIMLFGFVLFYGAPYLPTKSQQINAAFTLLDLKKGQTLLELGCGDGRVLRAAANKGFKAVGYEINPLLFIAAKIVNWKYRSKVRIIWGNYWSVQWPNADGIYVFLLDKYMKKLDTKIIRSYKGRKIKLATFAFKVPGRKINKSKNGVHLYVY